MKHFNFSGIDVVFWRESNALFFKVFEVSSEVYCCGDRPIPETDKEALELTQIGWIW